MPQNERKNTKMRWTVISALTMTVVLCSGAQAMSADSGSGGVDAAARVLLGLVIVLTAAKLGGEVFVRIGQPAVLGELVVGILVGNVCLLGIHALDFIRTDENIEILSQIGVVLLLFQVGLESDLDKMLKVGGTALAVATLGVVTPFLLGWGVARLFIPNHSVFVHVFIGATLCATSVGITARVLLDLGRLQSPEARIILGAAVIDDVQALVILAVVTGIIGAAGRGESGLSVWAVILIVIKATAFLAGAIIIGRWIAPAVFKAALRMQGSGMLLTISLAACFGFAYLAKLIGLATIVGAFAAGLILEEIHWRRFTERGEHSIHELVSPLTGFLVPVFFVTMGARVDLTNFARVHVLGFAAVLTLAAILGKQVCSLGVTQRGINRIAVGIGMVPRGEVGLIFAAIGHTLMLHGQRIVTDATFSAIVIMVVITTMLTPPALKWSLSRSARAGEHAETYSVEDTGS